MLIDAYKKDKPRYQPQLESAETIPMKVGGHQ